MTENKKSIPFDAAARERKLIEMGAKVVGDRFRPPLYDLCFHMHTIRDGAQVTKMIMFGNYFRQEGFEVSSMALGIGEIKGHEVILVFFDSPHPQIREESFAIKPYRTETAESRYKAPKSIHNTKLVDDFLSKYARLTQEKIRIPKKDKDILNINCSLVPYKNDPKTLIITVDSIKYDK